MDNIPSELLKNGGETTTTTALTVPEDMGDGGMAEGVDTIALHTFTKERAALSNDRTVVLSA